MYADFQNCVFCGLHGCSINSIRYYHTAQTLVSLFRSLILRRVLSGFELARGVRVEGLREAPKLTKQAFPETEVSILIQDRQT